jgi:hypothetical protein
VRAGGGQDAHGLIRRNLDILLERSLMDRYGYHCWNGNGVRIQKLTEYTRDDVPGIVGTEACAMSILDFVRSSPSEAGDLDGVIASVRNFCLDRLLVDRGEAFFFRYKPSTPLDYCVFNASMKAAQFVLEANSYLGEEQGTNEAIRAYQFLISRQKPDGSWDYSVDLRTGNERRQIDFHQGFMLDGLVTFVERVGHDAAVVESYERGLEFYRNEQFLPSGQGLYRHPRRWPTNIHNQAQGIVTFQKALGLGLDQGGFARTIADWTLDHMYDSRGGFFYYLKYPLFTNKIPYLRWGQAWMLYALSFLVDDAVADGSTARGPLATGRLFQAAVDRSPVP